MTVTEKQIMSLLTRLPVGERPIARQKIFHAEVAGFTMIGLWECLPNYPSHHEDLVGLDAKKRLWFLPDPPDASDDLLV